MRKLSISPVDAVFAGGGYPIEFLLLFEKGLDTRRLRAAIPSIARPFWPAFGTLEGPEIHSESYDEARHYDEVKGGAELVSRGSVAELTESFAPHVPRDMPGLLFFRVIHLSEGSALVFRMNHAAGDGYSVFFLLSTLAAMSRFARWPLSAGVLAALARPCHARDAVAEVPVTRIQKAGPVPKGPPRVEIERVPRADLDERLHALGSADGSRVSHNDLLSAMVLKRVAASQPQLFASAIRLSIPIDVRREVPAYGSRFFGNGIFFHHLDLDARRVAAMAPEELASELRGAMPALDEAAYAEFLRQLAAEQATKGGRPQHPFDPARGCLVTNISRLPIQHLDFGRGRPSRVVPLTMVENSAAVLREGADYVLRLVEPRKTA